MLTPVSTISAWPSATRRRTSASTSASARERLGPRTSGITQKLHENEQPSCTFTNARIRSRARTAGRAPRQPRPASRSPTALGRVLRRRRHDVDALAEVAQLRAGEPRRAAGDDDVAGAVGERAPHGLARLRDRLGRHRAAVHDVHRRRPPPTSSRPSAASRSRSSREVGLRDLAAEELAGERRHRERCPARVTGRSSPRRRWRRAGPCRTSRDWCRAPRRSRARSAARRRSAGRPTAARRGRARWIRCTRTPNRSAPSAISSTRSPPSPPPSSATSASPGCSATDGPW